MAIGIIVNNNKIFLCVSFVSSLIKCTRKIIISQQYTRLFLYNLTSMKVTVREMFP